MIIVNPHYRGCEIWMVGLNGQPVLYSVRGDVVDSCKEIEELVMFKIPNTNEIVQIEQVYLDIMGIGGSFAYELYRKGIKYDTISIYNKDKGFKKQKDMRNL